MVLVCPRAKLIRWILVSLCALAEHTITSKQAVTAKPTIFSIEINFLIAAPLLSFVAYKSAGNHKSSNTHATLLLIIGPRI